jgi:hypothetical protein
VRVRGMNSLRVEKLRHKNEAIKEINRKIGSWSGRLGGGCGITDELVGSVLTMGSFEVSSRDGVWNTRGRDVDMGQNLWGAYDAAQLHIAALKRMVNARGGLSAFRHNDGLMRGIIWCAPPPSLFKPQSTTPKP